VGLIVILFELITIVGVGLELVRHGPSARNRVFGAASLVLAAGAVGVLARATKRRWLPKATGLVAGGLVGVFLIAIAPSGL
jgi:hypothetical protein